MRRVRTADRVQVGIIVALVITALGFVATAPRAESDAGWGEVRVVEAPPSVCASTETAYRTRCLGAAAALALRR